MAGVNPFDHLTISGTLEIKPLPHIPGAETSGEIEKVGEGSPAMHAGIKSGDTLTEFDGKPVRDFDKLLELLLPVTPGQTVGAKLERGGMTISVTIKFPSTKKNADESS